MHAAMSGRLAPRILATATCGGSMIAILAIVFWGVISGPGLSADNRIQVSVVVAAAAVALSLAGVLCLWVLGGVVSDWHADGWTAAAVLLCFAGVLVLGLESASSGIRSVGGVLAPLIGPALLEPVARRALGTRTVAVVASALIGTTSLALFAVRDPFHDPACWADCSLNDVAPWPSARAAGLFVSVLTGLELVVAITSWILVARMVNHRRLEGADHPFNVVAVTASLAVTGVAAIGVLDGRDSRTVVIGVTAFALLLLGVVMALQPLDALRRRRRLRLLAYALGDAPSPGTLEPALARALGDRDVRVAYWLSESVTYVDATGRPVPEADGWAVTLYRDDEPIAAVHLGRTDRQRAEVQQLIGSAARLAIDSERLQAEIRAQLGELQASRQRIVTAADEARRRVERSIHDVVQAELLGALYEIARARSSADHDGRETESLELAGIADGVGSLVATIREFARGVYPAALDSAGLSAALGAVADDAPVVLTVNYSLAARPPAEVERAVFLLVHDIVLQSGSDIRVRIEQRDGEIVVRMADVSDPIPDHLSDRIGALGGQCLINGTTLEAVLPCG